ncbi:MAG: ArsR family transcriptional regulator [Propionibacteriaceae bacterium]|jgi:hypothetical protein|nr:ArsR family transcriptional regulator [Propionibacteriaceae bacterium]
MPFPNGKLRLGQVAELSPNRRLPERKCPARHPVSTGFLADRCSGNMRLVRRPEVNQVVGPLSDLLAVTFGPLPVLGEELAQVPGLAATYIYGSWAARYTGVSGSIPADVDVIAIGDADQEALDEAALRAQHRLHREVNIRTVTNTHWENPPERDFFIKSIKAQPLVEIPCRSLAE